MADPFLPPLEGVVVGSKAGSGAPQAASQAQPPGDIPPEVWATLQAAGAAAAERLRGLLEAPSFARLRSSDQARLIELALNRAYGPPIKREMTLSLSGTLSDAVAESLGRLAGQPLPEMGKSDLSGGVGAETRDRPSVARSARLRGNGKNRGA